YRSCLRVVTSRAAGGAPRRRDHAGGASGGDPPEPRRRVGRHGRGLGRRPGDRPRPRLPPVAPGAADRARGPGGARVEPPGREHDETALRLVRLLVTIPDEDVVPLLDAMSRLSPAGARRATKLIAGVVRTVGR